ncbi:MAG: heat-inducible transcription repressor HrcA [Clostridia bacterium]|nr:heat-inducible transcription repressor HrcA [Clostridia bacterium]
MDLSSRKKEILKEVINLFITTGEPVGSKILMSRLRTPCSSATIRNEMNDLEKLGLLEHPHTSAGRIPTARGYRLYVDSLMEDYRLSFEETVLLNSLLADKVKTGEQIVSDMASLLAKMTGYAVAVFTQESCGTIERFDGVYVGNSTFLLVMITSSGKAIPKQLHVNIPLSPESVRFIVGVLNDHLAKKELGGITLERMVAMEKDLGEYRSLIAPLIRIIYSVIAQFGRDSVTVKGLSNLLTHPEFSDPATAVEIFRELENEEALIDRFRQEFSTSLRVRIASGESGLDSASFVICPFLLGMGLKGSVCIIGPKRMNYGMAVARLQYLAKKIHSTHRFEPQLPLIETKEK